MKSMKFVKNTGERIVFPNSYKITYKDFKGRTKTATVKGLTKEEAMNRLRIKDFSVKIISARRA